MEANQITVRLDDEEYVRSVWERVDNSSEPDPLYFVYSHNPRWSCSDDNRDGAWSAAAEYTRERLEQVRKLGEEIHRMECLLMPPPRVLIREAVEEMWPGDMALEYVREVCAYSRTIARLEAELATLTRGMKPEALEGATR